MPPYKMSRIGEPTTRPLAAAQKQIAVASGFPNLAAIATCRHLGVFAADGSTISAGKKGSRVRTTQMTVNTRYIVRLRKTTRMIDAGETRLNASWSNCSQKIDQMRTSNRNEPTFGRRNLVATHLVCLGKTL